MKESPMALYFLITLLVFLLVAVSCVALLLGVLGEVGALKLVRCTRCDHFVVLPCGAERPSCCPYCRHTHLAHPLRTLRHPVRELVHH
jgi:hypothetical protein